MSRNRVEGKQFAHFLFFASYILLTFNLCCKGEIKSIVMIIYDDDILALFFSRRRRKLMPKPTNKMLKQKTKNVTEQCVIRTNCCDFRLLTFNQISCALKVSVVIHFNIKV